jgi:aspartate aminotransferase
MAGMAGRIARVRGELQSALESRCPDRDWSFITKQIGMFSFTGMTPQQVCDLLKCICTTFQGCLGCLNLTT